MRFGIFLRSLDCQFEQAPRPKMVKKHQILAGQERIVRAALDTLPSPALNGSLVEFAGLTQAIVYLEAWKISIIGSSFLNVLVASPQNLLMSLLLSTAWRCQQAKIESFVEEFPFGYVMQTGDSSVNQRQLPPFPGS